MELAARHFEEEKDIFQEFEQKYGNSGDFGSLFYQFSGAENDSYIPYGKISLVSDEEISGYPSVLTSCSENTRTEITDASVSCMSSSKSTKSLNMIAKVKIHYPSEGFVICYSFTEESLKHNEMLNSHVYFCRLGRTMGTPTWRLIYMQCLLDIPNP